MRAHSTLANVHLRARQPGSATARCAIASRRARQPVGRGFLRFRDCSEGTSQPRVAFLARPQQALAKMAALANDGPYSTEVREAVRAVRMASRLCIAVQQQMRSADREDKADDSPVTVADYGAQAVVAWALTRAFPEARLSLVAEEDAADLRKPDGAAMRERITTLVNSVTNAALSENDVMDLIDLGGSAGGSHGTHWVLDPIDGTRGFVGMRQYAIALGMIDVRIPAASLVGSVSRRLRFGFSFSCHPHFVLETLLSKDLRARVAVLCRRERSFWECWAVQICPNKAFLSRTVGLMPPQGQV
ncbi:unnamed protein product [Pedinophyceae sp. YPF-701]|nr:unnamed protein product [Pedinophyceae sp. YPF-701]